MAEQVLAQAVTQVSLHYSNSRIIQHLFPYDSV